MYPEQDLEEMEDDSWQISYLDIITIILGFLIILLSVAHFTDQNFFSVSGLFKSDVEEAEYITTPINKIQRQLEIALIDEIANDEIEIIRELNDLLIRLKSDNLYLSGSATINAESLTLLDKISQAIQNNAYNDFNIEVQGHTDDVPINSPAYDSNWELSTARATNLVKFLTGMGIDKERLKASGYADSRPLVPNVNAAGNPIPQNRAQNRRVTLRLYYETAPAIAENETEESEEIEENQPETIADLNSGCQFSVQIGGFQSFTNALNKAMQTVNGTDIDVNITHNGRLFSVRSAPENSLQSTLAHHEVLTRNFQNGPLAIVHQCYENQDKLPEPLEFQIQLGAFGTEENAQSFASRVQNSHNVSTAITTTSGGLFRVTAKPGSSVQNTVQQSKKLQNDLGIRNFVNYEKLISVPYEFNFQIQAGLFGAQDAANSTSQKISNLMGINTSIESLNQNRYALLTPVSSDWDQTLQTFSDLSFTSYELEPVIYLLEYQD